MTRVKISVTILAAAFLVISVSALAFDSTDPNQPEIILASTDHQAETTAAEKKLHGEDSGDASHDQSGGHHGSHANLGKILPLWS